MSTNKTTNLILHNWVGSDLFRREELNENFTKLDTKVGSIDATMAQKANRSEISANDAKISKAEADLAILNSSMINARNYGAKGDGVTDDTVAIQTALNALTPNGAFVLPPGRYSVRNLVIPDVLYVSLYFYGELIARTGGDTDYLVATFKYVNNIAEAGSPIKLIVTPKINGNSIVTNGLVIQTWDTTIESPDVHGCQNGIKITGETRNGTAFASSTLVNNVINNPRLHNNTQRGLWLRDPSRNKVTDFHMYGGYVLLNGVNGIDLESSAGCLIHGTHTYGNGRALRVAIGSLGLRINDCYMEETECISLDDVNPDTLVSLEGNTFNGKVRGYSYNANAGIASTSNTFRTENGSYYLMWSDLFVLSRGDTFMVANPYMVGGADGVANNAAPNRAYAFGCTSSAIGSSIVIEGVQEKNFTQTKNPVLQLYGPPTTGTWRRGDIVYNYEPSPGGYVGWVCTAAGTPGTWKGYGLIQV